MKKFLTITIALALLCGVFVFPSKAEDIEPEGTMATTFETTMEIEPEEAIEVEDIKDEEILEEEVEQGGETTEDIEEEAVEAEDESLDDMTFLNEFVGEDDTFEYYVTYDEDFNPNGGLCLNSICKHCHYGITEEATREEINNRFGVNICK